MNYPDSDLKVWGLNIRYNLNDYAPSVSKWYPDLFALFDPGRQLFGHQILKGLI